MSCKCSLWRFFYSCAQNFNRFDRNAKEKDSWFENVLEVLVPCKEPNSKDIALQLLLSFIGMRYNEEFVNAENKLVLILNG